MAIFNHVKPLNIILRYLKSNSNYFKTKTFIYFKTADNYTD